MVKRLRQIYLHFKNTDSRDSLLIGVFKMPLDDTTLNNFYIKHNVNLNFEKWLEKKGKNIFAKLGYLKVHISKGSGKLLDIDSISQSLSLHYA